MEITVNHQHYQLKAECSVSELLAIVLESEARNIAVAINQAIVSKSDWHSTLLRSGDQVILIKATQGG